MPTIYFIEYKEILVLIGENGNRLDLIKNEFTYNQFQKIKNKYHFVDLLGE